MSNSVLLVGLPALATSVVACWLGQWLVMVIYVYRGGADRARKDLGEREKWLGVVTVASGSSMLVGIIAGILGAAIFARWGVPKDGWLGWQNLFQQAFYSFGFGCMVGSLIFGWHLRS